jgi:hypothetical protein
MTIRVGMDQWAISNPAKSELLTDGLSGCVALAYWTTAQFALAHVASDAMKLPKLWSHYTHELNLMFLILTGGGAITGASLVYADDGKTDLVSALELYLAQKGVDPIEIRKDAGCRLRQYTPPFSRNQPPKMSCIGKKNDLKPDDYARGYAVVSVAGTGRLDNFGKLSREAADSNLPGEG